MTSSATSSIRPVLEGYLAGRVKAERVVAEVASGSGGGGGGGVGRGGGGGGEGGGEKGRYRCRVDSLLVYWPPSGACSASASASQSAPRQRSGRLPRPRAAATV